MKNRKNRIKKKNIVIIAIIFFLIIVSVIVVNLLFKKEKVNNFDTTMNLTFENRVEKLQSFQYEDYLTVGWLQVQGTNIDYPVLNHDAYNVSPTELNFGWRSSRYSSDENREVIIGHNLINVSSTPIRDMSILNNYEGLLAFTYDDFAEDNLYISYTKGNVTELYKIYAIGFFNYGSDAAESFNNVKDVNDYIEKVRKNSIYDYDIDVNSDDTLITVKTCTRYFGANEKQEFYIDARKVRKNEKIIKYKVTKNDNYKILSNGVEKEIS